jgi:hypothetical protein
MIQPVTDLDQVSRIRIDDQTAAHRKDERANS